MRRLNSLLILLLILGLSLGLWLGSCASGGGDDDSDDDTTDDDTDDDIDDDTDDDTQEDFDVWLDQFTPDMTVVISFGGQLQAEGDKIVQQFPPKADSFMLVGTSLFTAGQYKIDFDYEQGSNTPPDPSVLYIIGLQMDMQGNVVGYDEAYFSYSGNVSVDSTGNVGDMFAASVTELKMIQANLTFSGNQISIEVIPTGKKAYIGFTYLACKIANYPPGIGDICM